MKQEIHPDYQQVVFMDTNSGYKFLTGSTKTSNETIVWEDGQHVSIIKSGNQFRYASFLYWKAEVC